MIFIDRSRIEARWHCPELAYWHHYANGHGWDRMPSVDLQFGTAVHQVIQAALTDGVVNPIAWTGGEEMGWEPERAHRILNFAVLVVGLTFHKSQAWHNIMDMVDRGTHPEVEREFDLDLGGDVRYSARPDLLFIGQDGRPFIVNLKTSGISAQWAQWGMRPDVVGEYWALQKTGLELGPSWVFSIDKGKRYRPKFGEHYFPSPLFVAYSKGEQVSPTYKPGWMRFWLWERFTAAQWAEILLDPDNPDALESIYQVSGPHLPSPDLLAHWERAVELEAQEERRDDPKLYLRRFGKACLYPSKCLAYELCWGMAAMDPLSMGYWKRTPNHKGEMNG